MSRPLMLICALLVSGCASQTLGASTPFPEGTGTVLTGESANRLARPCSGRSPGRIDGAWTPTTAQIEDLERRLPAVFERHRREQWPTLHNSALDYYRQYAGLIIDGRPIIYVQGVIKDMAERVEPRRPSLTWRNWPIRICDGGAMSFDAVYNPSARSFTRFDFGDTLPLIYSPPLP